MSLKGYDPYMNLLFRVSKALEFLHLDPKGDDQSAFGQRVLGPRILGRELQQGFGVCYTVSIIKRPQNNVGSF